ncbi:MAG: preprotein translocase subunit SecE [Gammaproteobacteria bacterium]|nr:preprotein translocase subunit SecE [Gammaproteobacteria bacterium]
MGVQVPPGLPELEPIGINFMNDNVGHQESSLLDTVKLLGSVLILLVGIFSYYYLIQISILFRVLMVLASAVVSLVIFFQTQRGRVLWEFFQGSRVEIKKVIWPTKQETFQTTLTVFVFVLIMGIFFWLLDFLLLFLTTTITS